MGIELTKEEMELVRKGELDPNKILEHRQINPPQEEPMDELEQVKEDIRQANIGYKAAIQKNKDLYQELEENRKVKEEFRERIAELRIKKKKLMGVLD